MGSGVGRGSESVWRVFCENVWLAEGRTMRLEEKKSSDIQHGKKGAARPPFA